MAAGRFHLTWLRQASRGSSEKLKSRTRLYKCLDCGRQISITAGTAMYRSKLPKTDALSEQQALNLDALEAWWVELLEDGTLPGGTTEKPHTGSAFAATSTSGARRSCR